MNSTAAIAPRVFAQLGGIRLELRVGCRLLAAGLLVCWSAAGLLLVCCWLLVYWLMVC
jgi:hypothetical protein